MVYRDRHIKRVLISIHAPVKGATPILALLMIKI